jgi:hypothetical protein
MSNQAPPGSPQSDTYTGRSLEEMTLAQKMCELREDRLRLMGLEHSFFENTKLVGWGYAYKRWVQRRQLLGRGEHAAVVADLRRQIEDDIAAIENDALAWKQDDYRDSRLIEEVQRVLERFGREPDRQALADMRQYVKIHQQDLAAEIRLLKLDERYPKPSPGRALGKLRNFVAGNLKATLVIGLSLTLGTTGWLTTYYVVNKMNRNRPADLVGDTVDSDHPGLVAAKTVNDAAMMGNRIINVYLGGELGNDEAMMLPLHKGLMDRCANAEHALVAAQPYYSRSAQVVHELALHAGGVAAAWVHNTNETGHTETTCTSSTDSDGNTSETCTDTYVCDYVDHTWSFQPSSAKRAIEPLIETCSRALKPAPEPSDAEMVKQVLEKHAASREGFNELEPSEQAEAIERATDWLGSVPVQQGDLIAYNLQWFHTAATAGGEILSIKGAIDSFPTISTDRDHGCGGGNPPSGYSRCSALGTRGRHLAEHHAEVTGQLSVARRANSALASTVEDIDKKVRAGTDPDDLSDVYTELGERSITLRDALNPDSALTLLSRGWRIALPLFALFGLGTLGGIMALLILHLLRRHGYYRRMYHRGIY